MIHYNHASLTWCLSYVVHCKPSTETDNYLRCFFDDAAAGDADTWSSYIQNALCACHATLDIAYLGMDDSALKAACKAALDPDARLLTAPIPQQGKPAGQSVHSVGAVQGALSQLAGFLETLERMLTLSFPVAVPIPAHGLLMLLTRILSMDDSARQAGMHPTEKDTDVIEVDNLLRIRCCQMHSGSCMHSSGWQPFCTHQAGCSYQIQNAFQAISMHTLFV